MKNFTITVAILFLYLPLFSQQKTEMFDGEYQIRPGFNIVVTTAADGLSIQATGQPKELLTKTGETLYKIESINGTVDFSMTSKSDLVVVNMYGQTFHAPKLPLPTEKVIWKEIMISSDEMKNLEGNYQLNPNAMFIVTIEEAALFVQLTGQSKYQVFPYAENKYFYKVVEASLEFIKDDKGVVNYLLIHQNGMILQADKL